MDGAATVLCKVIGGASLKSLCHGERVTYALVTETLKHRTLLERALAQAGLRHETELEHASQLLLAHELLFGRGLRQRAIRELARGPAATSALRDLRRWHASLLRSARATPGGPAAPRIMPTGAEATTPGLPRYARVNTLKTTVAQACAALEHEGYRKSRAPAGAVLAAPAAGSFWVDPLVPELLVLPAGTELHQHLLVREAALVMQDKASCMAPAAVAPPAGAIVVDGCAAPGNKTSQLAALAAPGGRVLACERDPRRAEVLRRRTTAYAGEAVTVHQTDFLSIDPHADAFARARVVALDPSCSGSGIVERGSAHAALEGEEAEAEGITAAGGESRLHSLAAMQLRLVLHGMAFPAATTLVYSTCSVHPIENELVVAAAMRHPGARDAGWRLVHALPTWPCRGLPLGGKEGAFVAERCVRTGPDLLTNGFFVARFERDARHASVRQ